VKRKDRNGQPRKPTFAFMVNRKPALKNWDSKYLASVTDTLKKRGEIVFDESGQTTVYYLPADQPD
jgi:hypothetical protein